MSKTSFIHLLQITNKSVFVGIKMNKRLVRTNARYYKSNTKQPSVSKIPNMSKVARA